MTDSDLASTTQQDEIAQIISGADVSFAAKDFGMVALMLIEAQAFGVARAVAKYGVSDAQLYTWREEIRGVPALMNHLGQIKNLWMNDLANDSALAIKSCLDFIARAAQESDPADPKAVRAVAGAMKMAAEFRLASAITDHSLGLKQVEGPKDASYPALVSGTVVEGNYDELEEVSD